MASRTTTDPVILIPFLPKKSSVASRTTINLRFGCFNVYGFANQPGHVSFIRVIRQDTDVRRQIVKVRALTERVGRAIEALTVNYSSWEEARLVELGADVYGRMRPASSARERWRHELETRRAFAATLPRLRAERPEDLAAAVEAVGEYERLLRTASVSDDQVAERLPLHLAAGFAARTVARLLLASPAALLGSVLNFVPFWVVHAIASRFRHEPNQIATYQLFPGLVLYPATWRDLEWLVKRSPMPVIVKGVLRVKWPSKRFGAMAVMGLLPITLVVRPRNF